MAERVQLRRTKGWRKPENTVVVARPSKWGNPYTIADYEWYEDCTDAEKRSMAVSDFKGLVEGCWKGFEDPPPPSYPSVDEIRADLRGKNLACWCPLDRPCHADVLLEVANA